jgi:hypothetical protein
MSIESTTAIGTRIVPGRLLRGALRLDAAVSTAFGVGCIAVAGPLSSSLELPVAPQYAGLRRS